ncbi:NAD(P)-dependent alcohol dehydrogenase [Microbacterium sp. RD1]|uniref:NAD(P)-dependent alcohol dehydrogenase n=1 Tax=Microbacterium sp. RD1 TaxID=3457313 RepID=UPI003FA5BBA0
MSTRARSALTPSLDEPFHFIDVDIDDPGPGEILVQILASGVCHTDAAARHGDLPFSFPGVLGHEGSGIVAAVGSGVTTPAVGDHVVLGWPFCGECRRCLDGEPRYCDVVEYELLAGTRLRGDKAGRSAYSGTDGETVSGHFFGQSSFATYSLATARQAVVIPQDVPLELAATLACGIQTGAGAVFNTAKPTAGQSLVVFGAGAVGLSVVMAATNTPATRIVAVDMHASRLELARRFGATDVIDASASGDVVADLQVILGGPADFAFECTGSIRVTEQATRSVGKLGTTILIGGAPLGATFEVDHGRALNGARIVGTLGGSGRAHVLIPALLQLWKQGRFPFDQLVQTFPFDDIADAFEASRTGAVIKPVLTMSAAQR